MFKIRIAGLTAELCNRHAYVAEQCRDYTVASTEPTDLLASVTDGQIEEELSSGVGLADAGYAESICLYRSIAGGLHAFDALLMHGAVIGFEGKAYAFLAPSGTGKSTHIRLWRRYLRDGVIPVNGDKPILRFDGAGVLWAYGTPWAGKEGWQRNVGLPLCGICILSRGKENTVARMEPGQSLPWLMRQIYLPSDPVGTVATMDLVDRMLERVPVYRLFCNMEEEAAKTSFEALTGMDYLQAKGKYA